MPLKISDACTNCGICEILCPYNAIYPGGVNWRKIHNKYFVFCEETLVYDEFWSPYHYYVVPYKCTECIGKFPQPICKSACTKKAMVSDLEHRESEEHLFSKKEYLETIPGWM